MPSYVRQNESIIVMDVTGKPLARAQKELNVEGFKGVVYDTVYSSKVDPQTVVNQYPLPGEHVKPGRTIRLKIARPEKMILVPSLVGQSRRSAEISLQQLGLRIDTVYTEFNPDYPKGTVAWQSQKPGTTSKRVLVFKSQSAKAYLQTFFKYHNCLA